MHVTDNYSVNSSIFSEFFRPVILRLDVFHFVEHIAWIILRKEYAYFLSSVGWSSLCLYHWDGNDVDVVQKYLVQEKEKEKQRSIKKQQQQQDDNNINKNELTTQTRSTDIF